MNKPALYLTHNEIISPGSETVLKKYFNLVNQNTNEENTVLDIGCGPGSITHDVFFPYLKGPTRKVVGCDVSKNMIDFANETYGDDVFSFRVFDIGNEVPQEYLAYFNYVVSFWALQWIRDQRKLYSNIHQVMKPNGQMFLLYIARSKLFDIYQTVWNKPAYSPYISDFNIAQSCFQKSEDPKKELREIIEGAGFEVSTIKIEEIEVANATADDFKEFLTSISPVYDKIPDHLKEQFILDHVQEVDRKPEDESSKNYYMIFDVFVVYAKVKK